MTSTIRSAPVMAAMAVMAVIAALIVMLPTTAAHASTTHRWTAGYDMAGDSVSSNHTDWNVAANWDYGTGSVPGPGDSVVLTHAPAHNGVQAATELTVPAGGVSIAALTIERPASGSVRLLGGPVTLTESLEWTGGEVHAPITVTQSAVGRVGAGELKPLHAKLTVQGALRLDNIGDDVDTRLQPYPDYDGDDDGITVTRTGTLTATGLNLVGGTGCCTDPARIVNRGTIDVVSGRTTLHAVQVDQFGTVKAAPNARLTVMM